MMRGFVALLAVCGAASAAKCAIDVAFVFDSSESIGDVNFKSELTFANKFLSEYSTQKTVAIGGSNGIHVALVPFNTYGRVALPLSASNYAAHPAAFITNAISSQTYAPGLSNPADALDKVEKDVFSSAGGDRPDYPNVVVIISDGNPTKGTPDPVMAANNLRNQGVQIIAVSVCGMSGQNPKCDVNKANLAAMAGGADNVFAITTPIQDLFQQEPFQSSFINCDL